MMFPMINKHCLQIIGKLALDDDVVCQCQWEFGSKCEPLLDLTDFQASKF